MGSFEAGNSITTARRTFRGTSRQRSDVSPGPAHAARRAAPRAAPPSARRPRSRPG